MSTSNSLRVYGLLFSITLLLRVATALPLEQAGYMDASYALHVAENLARGRGFTEDILWNYLDQPAGVPHPSNLYWMPLPSLMIAPFFALLGVSYRVAQIPFIILSSFLPLLAFYQSRKIFQRDDYAWAAALLTAFSGFYTVYWVSPDNFTPFALTAALCLLAIARGIETSAARYFFLAGLLAGLSHLSRADGLLLLAVAPIALLLRPHSHTWRHVLRFTFCVLLGYLLLMSPWFLRNFLTVGSPYPSAGTKTLWLTNYDEVFRYADDLTLTRYLAWGLGPIVESKAFAAFRNIFIVVFGDLQVFLAPFAAIGLWQLRRQLELLPFFVYAVLLYLAMTLLFTFPSWRGSMLHSSAAWLPFLAVAAPPGIDATVRWIARRRRTWDARQASRVFRGGFVTLAIFLSMFLYAQGIFGALVGGSSDVPLWNQRDAEYAAIAHWLTGNAAPDDMVMDVDPPSFYNVSHRRTIMVPTDGVAAVFDAARRYRARYLLLRFDHPAPLNDLYHQRATVPGLQLVADFRDAAGHPAFVFEVMR
ncbi:MAG: glycosyltransferase family 39 protein [Chloroflexi bacterium]|nr:glycosyltransferase family 39 protein [Chloroflexota bacterium]